MPRPFHGLSKIEVARSPSLLTPRADSVVSKDECFDLALNCNSPDVDCRRTSLRLRREQRIDIKVTSRASSCIVFHE